MRKHDRKGEVFMETQKTLGFTFPESNQCAHSGATETVPRGRSHAHRSGRASVPVDGGRPAAVG